MTLENYFNIKFGESVKKNVNLANYSWFNLGEAHIERPKQPTELSDDEWAEYLFMRKNIKGVQFERWNHAHGCRKWFNMVRDTSNDQIKAIYKMGEKPPSQ